MDKLLRYFRKMNVILFLSFVVYSLIFIFLISTVYNFNWERLFTDYKDKQLESSAYKIMDDMRREGMTAGPFIDSDKSWLDRRATLNGVLLRYVSADREQVWVDTFIRIPEEQRKKTVEFAYTAEGRLQGYLTVAHIMSANELDPANIAYRESMQQRFSFLLISIIIISIALSYLVSKQLTKHLRAVYVTANLIRQGSREVTVPIRGPEEIRQLAVTMNELSQDLKRQEDWRHHLMEDLTHELRTPMTSMLSQMEAIIDGIYKADEQRMQELYDELIRLSRLVNDMERLSEAEGARFTLNIKRTDMVQLVKRIYHIYTPMAKDKGIRLLFEATNVPCYCEVDPDKMIQIISNIVSNAIKYTGDRGTVKLGVQWGYTHTLIYCEDNGIGISEKDLPFIFNRLYRADKSRSRFSGGVGLGLSIAKALVEAHEGRVEVTSQLGRGTTFYVYIPNLYKGVSG